MPATRYNIDRDVKSAQILDAAETLLLRDGYEATTMAAVGRAAGVASNNAVYWYFPSKDDLLAAVLRRRQKRVLEQLSRRPARGLEARVLALLAELDKVGMLTASVHERVTHSTALAETHDAFHAAAERYLRDAFQDAGLARAEASRSSAAVMAMVEGIHLHEQGRDTRARNRLVVWTVRRLVAASLEQRERLAS